MLVFALSVPASHRLDDVADNGEASQWHTVDPHDLARRSGLP